jgi:hypothetical protein
VCENTGMAVSYGWMVYNNMSSLMKNMMYNTWYIHYHDGMYGAGD